MEREPQSMPVRVYQSEDHIMVAVPMPGLEPGDISVNISEAAVIIRGEERGTGQHERDLLLEEWRIGPYYRELLLPQAVDGALANATYGNGVLILSLPKLKPGQKAARADFQLQKIDTARGERVGHSGKAIHPTTTAEHTRKHR